MVSCFHDQFTFEGLCFLVLPQMVHNVVVFAFMHHYTELMGSFPIPPVKGFFRHPKLFVPAIVMKFQRGNA